MPEMPPNTVALFIVEASVMAELEMAMPIPLNSVDHSAGAFALMLPSAAASAFGEMPCEPKAATSGKKVSRLALA